MSYTPKIIFPEEKSVGESNANAEEYTPRIVDTSAVAEVPQQPKAQQETEAASRDTVKKILEETKDVTTIQESKGVIASILAKGILDDGLKYEAENVQALYFFPLEDARNKLYEAFMDEKSSQSLLAAYAKKVVKATKALSNFWSRFNVALDEANGLEVLPETKEELEHEKNKYCAPVETPVKDLGTYTKKEIDAMEKDEKLLPVINGVVVSAADVKQARITRNEKFLRRTNRQPGKDYTASLSEAVNELHEWGSKITTTMANACAKFGYVIPEEWIHHSQTPEERAKAKNESNKRAYRERTKVSREMREAQKEEEENN